ncbi:hypothetical protein [Dyadobacter sp. 22481]|uniref:hypothetical protein n=1 Tax=Dyadobacter sp. 22481 TaxID=3453926 RepID=UPI003F8711F6
MKLNRTTTLVIQGMLVLGLLGACQNEDVMTPADTIGNTSGDNNAKVAASEIKLVSDGDNNLQYHKTGRYTGYLSKVSEPSYYTNYSYNDSGVQGDYWITSKRYTKSTNTLIKEIQYHVVNKRCIKSFNITDNQNSIYSYNETGRLNTISREGSSIKVDFNYIYDAAADAERLTKTTYSNSNGAYKEVSFLYSIGSGNWAVAPKPDKYFLNPVHSDLDKYLRIFGKFSDMLVQQVTITPLPYTNQTKPYYKYFYSIDSDGYAISRSQEYYPLGYGNQAGKQSTYAALNYMAWVPGI